jgi:hypothetical protein
VEDLGGSSEEDAENIRLHTYVKVNYDLLRNAGMKRNEEILL